MNTLTKFEDRTSVSFVSYKSFFCVKKEEVTAIMDFDFLILKSHPVIYPLLCNALTTFCFRLAVAPCVALEPHCIAILVYTL